MVFNPQSYWITNAHVAVSLLASLDGLETVPRTREDLLLVDLEICQGKIAQIVPQGDRAAAPSYNLRGGQVWPCFVDMHTHLDKGHIWPRSPNLDGTFETALNIVPQDSSKNWDFEDTYRRFEFGLKCSYAQGTKAIRTHIDSAGPQVPASWEVFKTLKQEWQDKIDLQGVTIMPLDIFLTPEGEQLADRVTEAGGMLGGVTLMNPDLDAQLDRVFSLAKERQLDLDFHVDESLNPDDISLRHVAAATLRHNFPGRVTCDHCCSLSVQDPQTVAKTIELVKEAEIAIVSLPMCNLYLQDRQSAETPRLRGVTLVRELKAAGVPVIFASDNCRDPFYGFGDHDMLEVFTQSVRIAHLDIPYGDWPQAVTLTPAKVMNLPEVGQIGVGLPADLVLFKGRNYSELLARSQHDRIVLRNGQPIDTTLPEYAELDDLMVKEKKGVGS
ncbi:MAG: cytosine deaminase [Desertifilum sp.]|nr:cytosine deaminase [Desertifilum sp.]